MLEYLHSRKIACFSCDVSHPLSSLFFLAAGSRDARRDGVGIATQVIANPADMLL
jgi:hypothetical protein